MSEQLKSPTRTNVYEYIYNLYVVDLHDIDNIKFDETLIKHHTILTFGIVDNSAINKLKEQYKHFHYINYPFPNVSLTTRDTIIQLYYKLNEIFKHIDDGLMKGDVYILCCEPDQLASLVTCIYITHKTDVPVKIIIGGLRNKNAQIFADKFKYKELLEKYLSSHSTI